MKFHTPEWANQKLQNNYIYCRVSPTGLRLLSPMSCHSALGYVSGSTWFRRPVGLNLRNLKGNTQNLTCTGTQGKISNLIGVWVRPTCWSWRVSQRGERQLRLRVLGIDGIHIERHSTAWTLLVVDILAHYCQDLAPLNTLYPSAGMPQAKQLTGWGHSHTHQQTGCIKSSWAHSCL